VNNAGIAIRKPLVDFSMDEARRLMDTNYFGCVAMCDAVVPGMMERGQGRIFNVGSGLGA
jgi:short-subunit dehydrogenase